MIFNSIEFLVFILIFLPTYFLLRGRCRVLWMLGASYVFYGWWDWRFLSLIMASTIADYLIGLAMADVRRVVQRKFLLIASVGFNLGLLGVFKYYDFFVTSLALALNSIGFEANLTLLNLILPVGISFYTFQTLSYSIDIYRGECEPEPDFFRFAAFVSLFPQLVAGPIVRAQTLLPQLRREHPFDTANLLHGTEIIIWGFFLKLAVADNLGVYVDSRFANPEQYGGVSLLLATVFFAFQIYGDFAGYSLIAIGLGQLMGFSFPVNFIRPYFATNFSDFWERWHISLSSWLRDYLYISLGGNRSGKSRTLRNLMLTMFLGGLWHGAAWTFVIWGLLHGCYLVLQNTLGLALAQILPKNLPTRLCRGLLVFCLVNLAWIFFRADSMDNALEIVRSIGGLRDGTAGLLDNPYEMLKSLMMISLLVLGECWLEWQCRKNGGKAVLLREVVPLHIRAVSAIVAVWMISLFGAFDGTKFIYFQF